MQPLKLFQETLRIIPTFIDKDTGGLMRRKCHGISGSEVNIIVFASVIENSKAIVKTSTLDDTIRVHVFCSFLAILLRRELECRMEARGYDFEWNDILHDLESIEEVAA